MDRQSNRFLEPERGGGTGMVGWAAKQLMLWGVGALILYGVVANQQLFRGSEPVRTAPQAAPAPRVEPRPAPAATAAVPAQPERSRALGQAVLPVIQSMTLRAAANGHVFLTAEVNGAPIQFMVDTGASWVSLTHADALRAGVGGALNYSITMQTANGIAKAAPVTLREVRVGQFVVDEVSATVMPEEHGISLLGQTFLKRLRSYEMHGDVLTLTWQ
jgi:aspartyl protease family protein